jgi:hypothetical protein
MRASASGGTPLDRRTALDYAMIVASGLCCLVAAWLTAVLVLVVPARAPASLVPWALVVGAVAIAQGSLMLASILVRRHPR